MFATEPPVPQDAPGLIEATRRFLVPTVALTLAGLILGVMFTVASSDSTTAEGLITLTDPRGNTVFKTGGSVQVDLARYAEDRADFAKSADVLGAATEALTEKITVVELRSACDAEGSPTANTLTVTCSFASEKTALEAVDSILQAYSQKSKAQTDADEATALAALEQERANIEAEVAEIRAAGLPDDQLTAAIAASIGDRLTSIEERATEIRTTSALFGDGIDFVDEARVPASTSGSVTLARNALIGAFVGGLIAVAVAWFRADQSPVLERGDAISSALGLPQLGQIHQSRTESVLDIFESPDQEYQLLASNLDAVLDGGLALFSSPTPIPHHAEVVISVALVASHSGKRVLLIDADTKNRAISTALGTSHASGFCDMLTGEASPAQVTARIALSATPGVDAAELFLMGPGTAPNDVTALFRAKRSQEALEYLASRYDLVIIDTPPMLSSAETASLARAGGGMVLMVEAGTTKAHIENAKRQLSFVAAEGIGFVLVDDGRG